MQESYRPSRCYVAARPPAMTVPQSLILALAAASAVLLALGGCGRSSDAPASASAPTASKANVTVTIDAKRHKCIVALPTEAQGSFVACGEVVAFVKDELRLPSGALYALRTAPDVDEGTTTHVRSELNSAGYRPADGAQ